MKPGAAILAIAVMLPALALAEPMAPVALNSLSEAPHAVVGARLLDQRGQVLGQVARVQTDAYGRPAALAFTPAGGSAMVVIGAAAVSYDGSTLVAADDQPQIAALSGTRVASK